MIQRGSTTAIPFDIYGTALEGISEIYATFVQKGRPIAEKTYSDGKIDIEEGRLQPQRLTQSVCKWLTSNL